MFQPYQALLAAYMGLALYVLASRVIDSRPAARAGRDGGEPAGAAVRLLAVGRSQGARGRVGGRAAGGAAGSAAEAARQRLLDAAARLRERGAARGAELRRDRVAGAPADPGRVRACTRAGHQDRRRRRTRVRRPYGAALGPDVAAGRVLPRAGARDAPKRDRAREPGRAAQPPPACRHLAGRRLPLRAGRPGSHLHPDRPAPRRRGDRLELGMEAARMGAAALCDRRGRGSARDQHPRLAVGGRQGAGHRFARRSCSRAWRAASALAARGRRVEASRPGPRDRRQV